MLPTACQWQKIPKEFSSLTTAQWYFYRFCCDGTLIRINQALVMKARELAGCLASPTAGVIENQPVKPTKAEEPRGLDAGIHHSQEKSYARAKTATIQSEINTIVMHAGVLRSYLQ